MRIDCQFCRADSEFESLGHFNWICGGSHGGIGEYGIGTEFNRLGGVAGQADPIANVCTVSQTEVQTAPPELAAQSADLPLDSVQIQILQELLGGGDAAAIITANHMMPSIAADFINEALFDEIGDTVILCEDDRLLLVEDYIEDLKQLLSGLM